MMTDEFKLLQKPLTLPCGVVLKNRLAKSPMSDSLGNGQGGATKAQIRLYERWAQGGAALSLVGEVQGDHRYPEKPGNLILNTDHGDANIRLLTEKGRSNGCHFWPQIGHAGALAHPPISQPRGPSKLSVKGLACEAMSIAEIQRLPASYAETASHAKSVGFTGVLIHAGHGFLLSQFLSPLFNHRTDQYGGTAAARCSIILEIIETIRTAVGSSFPVGIRVNATDHLEGGLTEEEALVVIQLLDKTSIDLIDISGGTYFPGAKASSDGVSSGPYFLNFAQTARRMTQKPLMITGGFKRREQAISALTSGAVDMIGLARSMVLNPNLANVWMAPEGGDPTFPVFKEAPPGGITAWYTMRLTELGEDRETVSPLSMSDAIKVYAARDEERSTLWRRCFLDT